MVRACVAIAGATDRGGDEGFGTYRPSMSLALFAGGFAPPVGLSLWCMVWGRIDTGWMCRVRRGICGRVPDGLGGSWAGELWALAAARFWSACGYICGLVYVKMLRVGKSCEGDVDKKSESVKVGVEGSQWIEKKANKTRDHMGRICSIYQTTNNSNRGVLTIALYGYVREKHSESVKIRGPFFVEGSRHNRVTSPSKFAKCLLRETVVSGIPIP